MCAVVGAGVLGLPYAFSFLGWMGGLITLATLCAASLYTSDLLTRLHDLHGIRLNTYRAIGEAVWGPRRGAIAVCTVQYTLMEGLCITYSVTAGQSLKGVVSSDCSGTDCQAGLGPWIIVFGSLQLFLSQIPDFHSLWWVSLLGAIMSVGYCSIAAGASIAEAASPTTSVVGAPAPAPVSESSMSPEAASYMPIAVRSTADKVFGIFNALGSVAFTFGGQVVVPEIQATLATPPKSSQSMMKGVGVAYVVVVLAYFSVAISGYAAFGTTVQPDVLLSIQHPPVLVDVANLMVVIHVAAGYQVFAMPLFAAAESAIMRRTEARSTGLAPPRPVVLRLVLRSAFVVMTTLIACLLPFFGDLMGLIASIGLMPVTFILPPLLWISATRPRGFELAVCASIAACATVLALLAFVGSLRNILVDASHYSILGG